LSESTLVTGGLGFVGAHVVELLLERGDRVRVLDLATPCEKNPDVEYVQGSITDSDCVHRAMQGVDQVFHLAANAQLWSRDRSVFEKVNHQGTRTVLDAAKRAGVGRLVHTSSLTVLAVESVLARSTRSMKSILRCCPYVRAKLLAERAVIEATEGGLPAVMVSLPLPIGPGDIQLTPPSQMLLGFLNGAYPAYMESSLNLADVRDLARGHLLAGEQGKVGERYLLCGETLQLREILSMLEALTGLKMPRRRLPIWVALVAARIDEALAAIMKNRTPTATVCGVRLARSPRIGQELHNAHEIGFAVRPAEESLADAVRWFQSAGLLRRSLKREL
jgi:hopanoid-associated sugar epimerase